VDPVTASVRDQRRIVASVVLAGAVLILVVLLQRGGVERRSACRSTLIPAYLPATEIARLVAGAARPRLVIMNPANGPGADAHPDFRAAVRSAHAAGGRVLGYVPTGYGTRPAGDVTADIDRYRSWYGVDGVFLDEAAHDPAHLSYYAALAEHARTDRMRVVVVNPGVVPARGYFDVADVVVTFEGAYADYAAARASAPDWYAGIDRQRIAHLIYGASRAQALAAVREVDVGYLYVTSGTLPDPWHALPSYLHEEERALEACA
jgi:hypothetical protein